MIERARPSTPLVQHRHMNRFVVLLLVGMALVGMALGRPHAAEDDDASVEAVGLALRQEVVVTGAPYCASLVRETVTLRADGRRNVQRQRMPMCRDGEGRTRREVQPDGGPRRIVTRTIQGVEADGVLLIRLVPSVGEPVLSGVEIRAR